MKTILALIVSLFIAHGVDAGAQEQAVKPEYKEGDVWQYKVSEKDFANTRQRRSAGITSLPLYRVK